MSGEARMVGDLMTTVRTGKNDLVRQNALDLLYKLAADGLRAARRAVEAIERSKRAESSDIRKAENSHGHPPLNG